jgi:hypothetical protein
MSEPEPRLAGGAEGRLVEPAAALPARRSVDDSPLARARTLVSELVRDARGRETVPGTNAEHLTAAVEWLCASQDATGTGGCASAYNLVLGWGGPYPETTGYIIPTLYDYAEATGDERASERAEGMAEWLLTTQFDHGGFPAGDDPENETDPSVFNTGQILFGLVRAHEETGDDRYVVSARRAAEWLVSVQHEDGYWDQHDYNDTVHSYSARVGWALAEAAELTGEASFREGARANLRWVAAQGRENGWFEHCGFEPGEDPFLHTLAYTVRGLLEGGLLLDDERVLDAATRAADAFLDRQTREGVLKGQYDAGMRPGDYYCLTGNAQMAVVWYRLFEENSEERYRETADETVAFLKTRQRMDGPATVRGGLRGSDPVWGRYMYLRYPNWAAKFLADALLLAERHRTD